MMDYKEAIDYLYKCMPPFQHVGGTAYKEGIERTLSLDDHWGNPHRRYKTIHVAGTNGKGSCAHTLAAILQSAGYKTGLYTSPHLVDFRERIRVDGQMIAEEYVVDFVEKERKVFEPLQPSFFEVTTAMAFKYFADMAVDVAVVEVGLGGRLDSTNIITPVLSVITNISLDHTQFLGGTLAQIAAEKAGIIKPGIPVVVGEVVPDTKPVFVEKCGMMNSPLTIACEEDEVLESWLAEDGKRCYDTKSFGRIMGELAGDCQVRNTATILSSLKYLAKDFSFTAQNIRDGFLNVCSLTGLMGRWQVLGHSPFVVCDTGHNVGGWQYLASRLACYHAGKVHVVFGMVSDKDIDAVLKLLPSSAEYYFTKAHVARAMDENALAGLARKYGLKGSCYPTVGEAYKAARSSSKPEDMVFIGGSSFVVADFLVERAKGCPLQ